MEPSNSIESSPHTVSVCYVTVNDYPISSLGNYLLKGGEPLFDIGIIFAANINYDATTKTAVLGFNPETQAVLDNAATEIAPLQKKGIKVLLNVLGNHSPAGISNFADQASAEAFAKQLSDAVTQYGLDGIDFDDEWVDYGSKGIPPVNDFSFCYLVKALRELMPDKIISFYYYGPAASLLNYQDIHVGELINYSWNASYSTWNPPSIQGMAKSQISGAAICINPDDTYTPMTPESTAVGYAQQTLDQGYGVYLYYNLPVKDMSSYLSGVSQVLYGESVKFSG